MPPKVLKSLPLFVLIALAGCGGGGGRRIGGDPDEGLTTRLRFGGLTDYNGDPRPLTGTPTGRLDEGSITLHLALGSRRLTVTLATVDPHAGDAFDLDGQEALANYVQPVSGVALEGLWEATRGRIVVRDVKDGKAALEFEGVRFEASEGSDNPAQGRFSLSGTVADLPVKVYTDVTDLAFGGAVGTNATLTPPPRDAELRYVRNGPIAYVSVLVGGSPVRSLFLTCVGSISYGEPIDLAGESPNVRLMYFETVGGTNRAWEATSGTVTFSALASGTVGLTISDAKMEKAAGTGNAARGTFVINGSLSKS